MQPRFLGPGAFLTPASGLFKPLPAVSGLTHHGSSGCSGLLGHADTGWQSDPGRAPRSLWHRVVPLPSPSPQGTCHPRDGGSATKPAHSPAPERLTVHTSQGFLPLIPYTLGNPTQLTSATGGLPARRAGSTQNTGLAHHGGGRVPSSGDGAPTPSRAAGDSSGRMQTHHRQSCMRKCTADFGMLYRLTVCTSVCARVCVHKCLCMCACMLVCAHVCVLVCVHAHVHMYMWKERAHAPKYGCFGGGLSILWSPLIDFSSACSLYKTRGLHVKSGRSSPRALQQKV